MAYHAMHIFSAAVTPEEVGAFWTRKVTRMVKRAMAFRQAGGAGQITDVLYYDLVKEPMRAVERIYGDASLLLSDGARRSMQEQGKAAASTNTAFIITSWRISASTGRRADAGFAQYRAHFQLPYEDGSHGE
jgi:hypothetical protein